MFWIGGLHRWSELVRTSGLDELGSVVLIGEDWWSGLVIWIGVLYQWSGSVVWISEDWWSGSVVWVGLLDGPADH